jgi:hypothetical protein
MAVAVAVAVAAGSNANGGFVGEGPVAASRVFDPYLAAFSGDAGALYQFAAAGAPRYACAYSYMLYSSTNMHLQRLLCFVFTAGCISQRYFNLCKQRSEYECTVLYRYLQ